MNMAAMMNAGMKKKQTRGRQKIEIKRIQNKEDRVITFSKRKTGIFKKASDLATLCGAEVGLLIFSPAGKPFSFSSPSMNSITKRVFNQNPQELNSNNGTHSLVEFHWRARIDELNYQYTELLDRIEAEKERGKALLTLNEGKGDRRGWWEIPVEEVGLEELRKRKELLMEIYKKASHQLQGRGVLGAASSSSPYIFHGNQHAILPPSNYLAPSENMSGVRQGWQTHYMRHVGPISYGTYHFPVQQDTFSSPPVIDYGRRQY